jgi:hypothetical protein
MRFSSLVAAVALPFSLTFLGSAASAADNRVILSAAMDAQVFAYGERQGFKILGDTKGANCAFSFTVTLNGSTVLTPPPRNSPLPWTSPDLKLYQTGGANYSVVITAVDSLTNACKGQTTLSYGVVPEIGKLTAITSSAKVVAVNQTMAFKVDGKSFGYCKFAGAIERGGVQVAHAVISQVPYEYNSAFPEVGAYAATADEIDDHGMPEGCTGHLRTNFTVIPRPPCPAANESYQSPDDGEFGCLVAGVSFTPANYACPTGYEAFSKFVEGATEWGCHRSGLAFLGKSVITGLLGGAPKAAALGLGSPGGNTQYPDPPKILKIQAVAASKGAWRPNNNVFYAGEIFQFDVSGNIPNSAGYNPNLCGYTVEIRNYKNQITNQAGFTEFKIWDAGVIPFPGDYSVHAIPSSTPGASPGPCLGKAELKKVHFYPQAAWVTDFKLVGFGYHFNMADAAGMPQFCEACTSIFSPAHNRAFLQVIPTVAGTTVGNKYKTCTYNIEQTAGGDDRVLEVQYTNGDPSVPTDQAQFFSPNDTPPFWNMWGGASNTVKVTVWPGNNLGLPSCNIPGGSITKTITFFNDPAKGHVVK